MNGSFPLAKLLWVKKNRRDEYDKTWKLVITSKDYCVGRITGQWMTDTTSAATSGFLDFSQKLFREDWFHKLGLDEKMIPMLKKPMEMAGAITSEGEKITGIPKSTPVYAGIGDAGATTLASGISDPGEVNINLGTSGWVAAIGEKPLNREGVFNLVAADAQNAINVVPFLNAGNVHKWIAGVISKDEVDYKAITQMLDQRTPGSNGVVFYGYDLSSPGRGGLFLKEWAGGIDGQTRENNTDWRWRKRKALVSNIQRCSGKTHRSVY